jgi:anti-sigma factor RsiW
MTAPRGIDDKTLLAFLDGELAPARGAEVERAVAGDPALARRLEQHRALGARLRAAFDPVLNEPIPDALLAVARPPAEVTDLAAFRARRTSSARPGWLGGRGLGLIAASLLAVAIVGQIVLTPPPPPITERDGRLVASGRLAHALDVQLASAGAVEGTRIDLTFRDHAGAICRTFQNGAAAGVACRDKAEWAVKAVFADPGGGDSNGYRMASAGDPSLMRMVGDMMEGDAFDPARERSARAGHWRVSPP